MLFRSEEAGEQGRDAEGRGERADQHPGTERGLRRRLTRAERLDRGDAGGASGRQERGDERDPGPEQEGDHDRAREHLRVRRREVQAERGEEPLEPEGDEDARADALVLHRGDERVAIKWQGRNSHGSMNVRFEGVLNTLMRRYQQTTSEQMRTYYEQFLREASCKIGRAHV